MTPQNVLGHHPPGPDPRLAAGGSENVGLCSSFFPALVRFSCVFFEESVDLSWTPPAPPPPLVSARACLPAPALIVASVLPHACSYVYIRALGFVAVTVSMVLQSYYLARKDIATPIKVCSLPW